AARLDQGERHEPARRDDDPRSGAAARAARDRARGDGPPQPAGRQHPGPRPGASRRARAGEGADLDRGGDRVGPHEPPRERRAVLAAGRRGRGLGLALASGDPGAGGRPGAGHPPGGARAGVRAVRAGRGGRRPARERARPRDRARDRARPRRTDLDRGGAGRRNGGRVRAADRGRGAGAAGAGVVSSLRAPFAGGSGTTVLVVDDEPQIRRALRTSLEAHGYAVRTAANGEEALVAAAERAPDLVFLDLGLPDLDGTEVIRRLRAFSDVPVIVLSVRDQQADKVAALDAGADDYVTKPFGMEEVLARLRAQLRRAQPEEPAPALQRYGDLEVDL